MKKSLNTKEVTRVKGKKLKGGIGIKLLLSITLCITVICSFLGGIAFYIASESLTDTIGEDLAFRAQDNARYVSQGLKAKLLQLELLSAMPEIRSMDWSRQKDTLLLQVYPFQVLRFTVIDPSGNARSTDNATTNLADRDYFKRALSGESNFTDPFTSKIDNKSVIVSAVPIKETTGEIKGVLTCAMDADMLLTIVKDILMDHGGYAFIVNHEGTLIAHPKKELVKEKVNYIREAEKDESFKQLAAALQQMIGRKPGTAFYEYNEVTKIMGYAPVKGTNWSLALTVARDEVLHEVETLKKTFFLFTLLFILLGVGLAILLSQYIKRPLAKLVEYADELSRCNLSVSIDIRRKDEFGQTGRALVTAVQAINRLILEIKASSKSVRSFADEINRSAFQIGAAGEEVAKTTQELAEAASEQAVGAQKCVDLTEELTGRIEKVYERSKAAVEDAVQLKERNTVGMEAVGTLQERFSKNTEATSAVKCSIEEISRKSAAVTGIVQTISSLASQTNLLALNAAIEAARAGEYGRGFGVVAEEIRKLAENSAAATREIQGIITEITSVIHTTGETMAYAHDMEKEAGQSMEKAAGAFEDLRLSADRLVEQVEWITGEVKVIDQVKGQVLSSIERISAVSEEAAAGTEEISASAQEQTASLQNVSTAIKELQANISGLDEVIATFR